MNIICNLFILLTETKTTIKSGIVERIRKGIFKVIKIFIFILKSKLLLSKVFY